MHDEIKITYLYNSGFSLELDDCLMVFDYYLDEHNIVSHLIKDKNFKEVYFFVSHAHFDHFNPIINDFKASVTKYFMSYDIHKNLPPEAKTVVLNTYDAYKDDSICVKSFDSTDAGISFYVEKNGWKIFHAGDFNWWHWKGDTELNIAFARNGFKKQMKRLAGLVSDIAFFPVDSRLEEFSDLGVREFCDKTSVGHLISMHNVNSPENMHYQKWIVPEDFPNKTKIKSIWSPEHSGQTHIITR